MADFDPTTPSIARVYDYLLGGKDHFAVDREVAGRLLAVAPVSADVMRENRQFLARAVQWAARQGITQFIDLGFGAYSSGGTAAYNHSVADFTSFFGPLTLVEPGIADARLWHPDTEADGPLPPRTGHSLVGVARVG